MSIPESAPHDSAQAPPAESEPHPTPPASAHYVYILECAHGAFYTGYTTDPDRRVKEHNEGRGGRYTRSHRPVALVAAWSLPTRSAALRAEQAIKRMSRRRKLALVAGATTGGTATFGVQSDVDRSGDTEWLPRADRAPR